MTHATRQRHSGINKGNIAFYFHKYTTSHPKNSVKNAKYCHLARGENDESSLNY